MNKYHFPLLEQNIDQYADFIKRQAGNLRSNNARNSMALFAEMFKENSEQCKDGLKVNDNWVMIIETNLPTMLQKSAADKQFLARTAQ